MRSVWGHPRRFTSSGGPLGGGGGGGGGGGRRGVGRASEMGFGTGDKRAEPTRRDKMTRL